MMDLRDTLVLTLAGGVGSRLNILVEVRAKPAVPFAGFYRIIDFALSNVMNSGLTQVAVLTQYKPLSLMRHLGSGEAWDFTGRTRKIKILPPRTGTNESDWYKGTADAVRQNIDFLKAHPSRDILLLSGDHIYQMDFSEMIKFHRQKDAEITVAMMVVSESEIHQFGTGIVDSESRIIDWEEKPKVARTNLASMGIYVFSTDYLLKILSRDKNEVDFGMHIIPRAINRDRVFAFPFHGYWRDVGTVQAYWEANMDVLRADSPLAPQKWGIRPNPEADDLPYDRSPARFEAGCKVCHSLISAGCLIEGEVVDSVLSPGVWVKKGAKVSGSIILHDGVVEEGALIDLTIIDKNVIVGKGARVGYGEQMDIPNKRYPSHLYTGITLVGKDVEIPRGMMVGRNCVIHPGIKPGDFPSTIVKAADTVLGSSSIEMK